MKLTDIQTVAKKYNINTEVGRTKKGKIKYKTKKALLEEMNSLIK